MNASRIYFTFSLLCCLTSCGPEYTVARYGVKARLVEAGTRRPLEHTKARVVIDGEAFPRTTRGDGAVSVKPDLDWHLSWLGGPAWIGRPGASIGLEAQGYRAREFPWKAHMPPGQSAFREDGGVVDLGTVELEKR